MNPGEIILYQTEDGQSRIDVRLVEETVWLSAGQMAELFQRDKSVILKHVKNVFAEGELEIYLDFAELQARARKPMYMADWIKKLDQFLQISERDILTHAGKISAETARLKAESEYEKYQRLLDSEASPVVAHFQKAVQKAKMLTEPKKKAGKKAENQR